MAEPVISPPEVAFPSPLEHSRRQLEALLEVSEAIAQQRDLPALFHDLAARLHSVIEFDFLTLVLHDPARNVMRLHVLETRIPSEKPTGTEAPVENNPSGWVWQTQESFVVSDVEEETRFPEFLKRFREHNVRSLAIIPLTTAQRRLGAMGFGRLVPQCITDTELQFMQRVASQVAVAVDNALNFQSSQAYQTQLARERDRLRVLLEVNNALVSNLDLRELFDAIAACLRRVMHHEYTSLALYDPETKRLRVTALDFPQGRGVIREEMSVAVESSPSGCSFRSRQPLLASRAELEKYDSEIARHLLAEGVRSVCCVPLVTRNRVLGALNLASLRDAAFTQEDADLLSQVSAQVAIAVENALAFREIAALKNKLAEEKLYLEDEIRTELN